MADADTVVTIDTASSPWVLSDGRATTVDGVAETFVMRLIDLGTTGIWEGGGAITNKNTVALANGEKIVFGRDKRYMQIGTFADATAKPNPGSFWVREDDGSEHEVKVTTATVADADTVGDDNITTITFEYPGKPYQWTWTTIKMA